MVLSRDKREGESMMQVAESYMGELVHKSMVQVRFDNMESSVTKFKSCSLHDLMRDLSLSQAKAEDFFEAIDLRKGNDFHLNRSAFSPVANTRQLVLYCDANNRRNRAHTYFVTIPNHLYYRSMLIRNVDNSGNFQPVFGLRFADYRLLRVLALERVFLDRRTVSGTLFGTNIGKELGSLVYLRYLSIGASLLKIFPWIQKLVLLQTLKLFKWFPIKILPISSNSLGKLAHLRHLYLPNMINDSTRKYIKLRFNVFSKLETLENFNTEWCEVKDLPNLTRLQTLSLRIDGNYDDLEEMMKYLSILSLSSTSCLRYLALDILVSDQGLLINPDITRRWLWDQKSVLEELKIGGELPELGQLFEQQQVSGSSATNASLFRITKLKLSESYLKVDPMPVLEKIPTLRDLHLNHAYVGKEMVCSAMSFPKLTHLKLVSLLKLVKWRVEEGSMPILEYLYLDECSELEELPEGVRFLNSLERLGLHKMS